MAIRLVVADVDGTLVEPGRCVEERARRAVREAHERGAVFTIATGRIFSSAALVASELGITAPLIAGGGSVVGYPRGRVVSRLRLDQETALKVICMTSPDGGLACCDRAGWIARYVFTGDKVFTDSPGQHAEKYAAGLGVPVHIVDNLVSVVNDDTTHVVLRLDPANAADLAGCLAGLVRGSARVVRSLPHLVEVTHPHSSKGRALELLCSHMGIPTLAVLAIGDGESDTDMLAVAGVAAVVANAPPAVRRRCRYVTRNRYSEGVLEAVQEVCSGN